MIRTAAVPRRVRSGAAIVGVAATLTLTGCASGAAEAEPTTDATTEATETSATPEATAESSAPVEASSVYTDGTYTATGQYQTPESVEELTVTLTVADDVVTAVEVTGNPTKAESEQYQSQFIGGIAEVVVGKNVDEISVSRVAGSSLSSGGFNNAVEQIKTEAVAA